MSVTRDDVARLAGVSSATVSYVVNNGPRPVSDETRKKVVRAIEQLGYHPSAVARSLKIRKTTTIGVVVSDILNPSLSALAKGIEDVMLPRHYNLILCNSDENPERELMYLNMLLGRQVDGVILLPTGGNIGFLHHVTEGRHLPVVLMDRQIEGLPVDCVMFDNENGAWQATRHLIELGHRRIAVLSLPRVLSPGRERVAGYQRALMEAGITVDSSLVLEGSFKAEEGWHLVEPLLTRESPPTALFVSSNRLLASVLQYTKKYNIRIPQDLALVGFDDVPYYSYITPSITAVATDLNAMGVTMGRLLEDRIMSAGKK